MLMFDLHACTYLCAHLLQEWAGAESAKFRLLAAHVIRLTYRTRRARPCKSFLLVPVDGMLTESVARSVQRHANLLFRHPKIRVLKEIVARLRGLPIGKNAAEDSAVLLAMKLVHSATRLTCFLDCMGHALAGTAAAHALH